MTLTHDNFIEYLCETFPDFKSSLDNGTLETMVDNPIVTFGFFVGHFYRKLGDEEFENKLSAFLDRMVEIKSLDYVLDDFCLNLYSLRHEKGVDLDPFLNKLTSRTRKAYDLNVDMWERGNGIKR